MPGKRTPRATLASLAITGMLVGGCVLPYPVISTDSTPAPDVARYLPSDLRANDAEVLVLAQLTTFERPSDRREAATYRTDMKAYLLKVSEVALLGEKVKLETKSRRGLGFVAIPDTTARYGGLAKTDEFADQTVVTLRLLCVVAPDARTVRLSPVGTDEYDVQIATLAKADRDSFTQGLRESVFDRGRKIGGPCGIEGIPDLDRLRWAWVEDYLERIPIR